MAVSGYEKAALLLSTVGEEVAAKILQSLDPDVIMKISSYMSRVNKLGRDDAKAVFDEISGKIQEGTFQLGGHEYVKNMLTIGLGNKDAQKMIELASKEDPLDSFKKINPQTLANFLVTEHPQTIAMIMCVLESEKAALVMSFMPDEIKSNIAMRIATTDRIPESALEEISEVLKVQLDVGQGAEGKEFNGTKVIAEILNHSDRKLEQTILESIEENNPELSQAIQEIMFVFEDIEAVDDKGMQAILKELSTEDLSLALKGASDTMKDKVFGNMSKRAATLLKDEIEAKGAVRLSEVEIAQRNIVNVARKLEDEGIIILGGKGGEEFVE